jgi:ribbon-helix-helix protein, copG family
LGKIAEKEGEYFYIKCKFDAGTDILLRLFPQDYFSLYGVLEEIMARAGQKSEGFKVNVTMEQKLRWEEAARERDMTMSQMIREAVEMYIAVMKRQKELDKKQNIK